MGKIIWLASYMKSGNTWFRVFLSNLLSDSKDPVRTIINNHHLTMKRFGYLDNDELVFLEEN